jgi:hypothetical protein
MEVGVVPDFMRVLYPFYYTYYEIMYCLFINIHLKYITLYKVQLYRAVNCETNLPIFIIRYVHVPKT